MNKQEQHDYLISLIKELEKLEDKQALNNFIIVMEDLLKVKYRLRNYFDYPISAAEYDELTTYAENLLGVNRMGSKDDPHYKHLNGVKYSGSSPALETYSCFCINGREVANYHYNEHQGHYEFYDNNNQLLATITSEAIAVDTIGGNESWNKLASLFGDAECCVKPAPSGRTNDATSVDSASDVDSFNTMSDIEVEALVDYALIDMKAAEYIVDKYTPDQLTMDIVLEAAEKGLPVDGFKINKQTADYIVVELKKKQKYWSGFMPNAETIAAIEEAAKQDPKTLHSWEDVKKEFFGDPMEANYQKYWTNGRDAHFFYASDFIDAWKSADVWHSDIYYWPYNGQYIVGKINPVEWYKTKSDEQDWGPIFGPFNSPEELDGWYQGFWEWWHKLADENKVIYHSIPTIDNQWPLWNTNYIEMFRKYAAIKNEYDYNKIAAEAKNDDYSKMTEEEYMERYYRQPPAAFTKEWNERVADLVGQIKTIESKLDTSENPFDGEIIQNLEKELLNLLKGTL